MSIQLNGITKNFASRTVFSGLSFQIGEKSRIGLIGRNGCGKSTLLKLIMGIYNPDDGAIYRAPGMRVNYLSQEPRITPHLTLEEEMRTVFADLNRLEVEEAEILEKLNSTTATDEELMDWATRLGEIHADMDRLGASDAEARTARILKGLGFTLADYQRKSGEFSGGWQMRINLAKVLLEGADIILMDEPTNHLDLEACEWLENFLREYPGGLVLVSHDRRFLDQVTTETVELELGGVKVWPGNYSKHLELKALELEQQQAAYERQEKDLAKQTAFVERFKASATRGTQAKSREKQLAKVERIAAPVQDHRRMAFNWPPPSPSGRNVLTINSVSKSFGEKHLFSKINADIERRQRIFLLGTNGTGKTTLLRMVMGLEKPDSGEIKEGHNVKLGYFSQNQLDTLDPEVSGLDALQAQCPLVPNTELRTLLGRFLFKGDQVFKPAKVLSGGEKSKLALAKLMLSGPNTLLLDEPTNHMDIPSKEVMAEALLEYEGSMLCISHDRYFIQELATTIWELYNGHLLSYPGDYDYYLFKRDEMRAIVDGQDAQQAKKAAAAAEKAAKAAAAALAGNEKPIEKPKMGRKEIEKKIKKAETAIQTLESEIADLQVKLLDPTIQQDYEELHRLSQRLEAAQAELADVNDQWAILAENLASLE